MEWSRDPAICQPTADWRSDDLTAASFNAQLRLFALDDWNQATVSRRKVASLELRTHIFRIMTSQEPDAQQQKQIDEALADGRKIDAIKLYQEATSKSLAEAKAHIEGLGGQEVDAATIERIDDALVAGQKIEAIRIYRDASGKSLREAKEFIDVLEPKLRNLNPEKYAKHKSRRKGCPFAASVFLLLMLGGSILAVAATRI